MKLERAKEIVRDVADGAAPYAGERFAADGPYQRAGQGNRPPTHHPIHKPA